MKKTILLYIFIHLIISCKNQTTESVDDTGLPISGKTFTNPLLNYGPDPWVIQKDSFYYYLHTQYTNITIWKTQKMSDLKTATSKVVWTAPATGENSKNIWAPELHYLDNKWYLYYTAGSSDSDFGLQRLFVLENESADPLEGTWVEKGKLEIPNADFFTIDGSILQYHGNNYLIYSGIPSASQFVQSIYIAKLANPYTIEGERVMLSEPIFPWEKVGNPLVNEGPEILKNPAGKIFLIYSASFCGTDNYCLGMLSLEDGGDPMNPEDWAKSGAPVFQQKPENKQFATGHNGFFKSADGKEDWIIFHANSNPGEGCYRTRSPRMQKFGWSATGIPVFGEPLKIGAQIAAPSGE